MSATIESTMQSFVERNGPRRVSMEMYRSGSKPQGPMTTLSAWYTNPKDAEPLTNKPAAREHWVESEAKRTAEQYKSYIGNHLSKNTIHKMLLPENLAQADTDASGSINKDEFGNLLASAGVANDSANMQAALLFLGADKDGDGELSIDEIRTLVGFGQAAS